MFLIYKILHDSESTHTYLKKWSHILQQPISLEDWGKIWESTSRTSRCVVQKETALKILLFWYRTPDFLHARNPEASSLCWRYQVSTGTRFHIFWEYPVISLFWVQIQDLLQNLLNTPYLSTLYITYWVFLLSGIPKASGRLMCFIFIGCKAGHT